MIAQMNTQTPISTPALSGRISGTTRDTLGARWCVRQSRQFVETAATEKQFAEAARRLTLTAGNEKETRTFTAIAKWHFENAAEQYAKAIGFLHASLDFNLTTMNRIYITNKLSDLTVKQETMRRFADELQTESTN